MCLNSAACFQDANLTWHTDSPDFTDCFHRTSLLWLPFGLLWLLSGVEAHFLLTSKRRSVPYTWLNVLKLVSIAEGGPLGPNDSVGGCVTSGA